MRCRANRCVDLANLPIVLTRIYRTSAGVEFSVAVIVLLLNGAVDRKFHLAGLQAPVECLRVHSSVTPGLRSDPSLRSIAEGVGKGDGPVAQTRKPATFIVGKSERPAAGIDLTGQ